VNDYYAAHSREYFDSTVTVDPAPFLEPLAKRLAKGARILDVGCGSGRDLRWMKERGFRAAGFERSAELARLARETSGCEVSEGDFENWDFSRLSVDAILLVTALVHLPHDRLPGALLNIVQALRPGGWLLISLKEGQGVQIDDKGRTFYLWRAEELQRILSDLGFHIVETTVSPSALQTGEAIINLLACH